MKYKYFFVLTSVMILGMTISCRKDSVATQYPIPDTTHHQRAPRPTEIEVAVNIWYDRGNGLITTTLYDIISQLDTTHTTSIKVYMVRDGFSISLDKPIEFNNGILQAMVQSTDVILLFQSFNSGSAAMSSIVIKVVAL